MFSLCLQYNDMQYNNVNKSNVHH